MQPQVISVIPTASATKATSWLLTSTGVPVDTQTVTIGGVVFTSVTPTIGTTAGNVLFTTAANFITNLAALINAPLTTTANGVALSVGDANLIQNVYGLTAVATSATVLTLTSSKVNLTNGLSLTVSETETNFAWTTSTTSGGFSPQGMGSSAQASLQFTSASISAGNGVFTVEVSNDGSNWVPYNRLTTNATNTNAQTDTRVASVTLSTNTSSVVTIPDPYAFYRVKVVVTTDGSYSATAYSV